MHKYACWSPKGRLRQQLAMPYDAFLSFFIKHCTNSRSTCSKFSVLPCYVPVLECQTAILPTSGSIAWFSQLSGTLLLFTVSPVLTRQLWLPFHGQIREFCTKRPCKLLGTGNYYVICMKQVELSYRKLMRSCCRRYSVLVLNIVQLQLTSG